MDGNYRYYNYVESFARLDEILSPGNTSFEEVDALPSRDRLTFTNGFYGYCTALFVDIRDSSRFPDAYQRRVLARIYRAFISETVAILNGEKTVREVNIVGDCVWAVYNTAQISDIDNVFSTATQVNILENVLAFKMEKAGLKTPIRFGIGLSYGRALMIKAGYKGSTINDVVYWGTLSIRQPIWPTSVERTPAHGVADHRASTWMRSSTKTSMSTTRRLLAGCSRTPTRSTRPTL